MLWFQKLIEESLKQQKKLNHMSAFVPQLLPERMTSINQSYTKRFGGNLNEILVIVLNFCILISYCVPLGGFLIDLCFFDLGLSVPLKPLGH